VAVDGNPHGWDALEWAAAQAPARQCALRIVHAVSRPPAVDALTWPLTVDAFGEHHHSLAGGHTTVAAVLQEGGGQDALIVLGRGRKAGRFSGTAGTPPASGRLSGHGGGSW